MVSSMTGFGSANAILDNKSYTLAIRTLNSKQADVTIRLPQLYRDAETPIRTAVVQKLSRGRIEVSLTITDIAPESAIPSQHLIDVKRLSAYLDECKQTAESMGLSVQEPFFAKLLSLPGVILPQDDAQSQTISAEEEALVEQLTDEAIRGVLAFRQSEGIMLGKILSDNLKAIEEERIQVSALAPQRIDRIREQLTRDLSQITDLVDYDKGRLEQELIYYIEKLDVNEELNRLAKHLTYFRETMEGDFPQGVGKKLGFIAQEMGREINTLGSKSNDTAMQHKVVRMKDHLEQIKEQVLNVL